MGVRDIKSLMERHTSGMRLERAEKIRLPSIKMPKFGPLEGRFSKYLEKRGFNVDEVSSVWGARAGGSTGTWKWRVIIPITVRGQLVSWQARDITGKAELRYLSVADDKCVLTSKEVVYGLDQAKTGSIVVAEGPLDVWKLGPGAVCMFGTAYTGTQVAFLRKFSRVRILFDNEEKAQSQARKLAIDLASFGTDTKIVRLKSVKDPGDLPIKEARQLLKELTT
jgi:DNA primase